MLGCVLLGLLVGACSGDAPKARTVSPVVRDVPSVLRGTIGSEAVFRGADPVLVGGLGLVVGLAGTGGGELPDRIAVEMERELGLMGVGKAATGLEGTALEGRTPRQVLRDPNVAVVVVRAAVPPASPEGATFDVLVEPVSPSVTSLEGGTLWTTRLRLNGPTVTGGVQTRVLGEARGPIYINPFADPATGQAAASANAGAVVNRRVGRVLGGGVVSEPVQMELALASDSFSRARSMVSAINSRFPETAEDDGPVARGRNRSSIAVRVPSAFRDRMGEFVQLLRFTQIDPTLPEEYARRYVRGVKDQPWLATELAWSLEALGKPSIPFLRELYEYPELQVRMAGLRAGARLDDARASESLEAIAADRNSPMRAEAIELLGGLDGGPTVDVTLRQIAAEDELDTRVAAYEALAARAERKQLERLVEAERRRPPAAGAPLSLSQLRLLAGYELPGGGLQGVRRTPVAGKFALDEAPFGPGLIYVKQQGLPRIVLFGEGLELARPLFVTTWGERLMITADSSTDAIRLYYRDYRTGRVTVQALGGSLVELIRFMAHDPTPESPAPGLGLSYSEIVGVLYALHEQGGVSAAFSTERDRLMAAVLEASRTDEVADRPEGDEEARPEVDPEQPPGFERAPGEQPAQPGPAPRPSLVVPLERKGEAKPDAPAKPAPGEAEPSEDDRPEESPEASGAGSV